MAQKYHGTIEELQATVAATGIKGQWKTEEGGKHSYKSIAGGVLSWWSTNGTLMFQGSKEGKDALEKAVNEKLLQGDPSMVTASTTNQRGRKQGQIFVVHGHDKTARQELELALLRMGLQPFILVNTAGGGLTIIEALEGKIGKDFTSDFGIVLITPDDVGYSQEDGSTAAQPRARQNVVLETGMILSSLTRQRMALVVKGKVELPSDLQGVIRIEYKDHIREVVPRIVERLREAGFDIDADAMARATA
jgi:predicted nucleotide-binding protein